MRIAIFSDNFYPELGGIQDSLATLAHGLGLRGHMVQIYAPKPAPQDFEKVHLEARELDLGPNVSVIRISSSPLKTAVGQTRMVIPTGRCFAFLKKFQPDVIHSNTSFGMGIEALWGAKRLGVPLIGTNHTAITEFIKLNWLPKKLIEKVSLRFVSWYYNHCLLVTAPSQSVFTEMIAHHFFRPYEVVSNPIDTNTFCLGDEKKKREGKQFFGLSPHTFVFAGRFSPEKNIDVLIHALAVIQKDIPDVVLALAGHGAEQSRLQILAEQLGIQDHLKFIGTLTKPQLAQLYQASDVFAIASTCETQGMVMMQALATGLPVVGVRARALPEYIPQNIGFVVEIGDADALAEKITFLFNNPSVASLYGINGHTFVQKFSEQNIFQKWEQLYTHVLQSEVP